MAAYIVTNSVVTKTTIAAKEESSLSPPGGIHTQELALVSAYHLQQGGNKTLSTQLYSARLTQQEKNKMTPRICKAYLVCWFVKHAGSITNSASLYSKF